MDGYSLSWAGPATYGVMAKLIDEGKTVTGSASASSTNAPIPIPRPAPTTSYTLHIEPGSAATSASEREQGDHGDASTYTRPGTVTDLDDPSALPHEVRQALATRITAAPVAPTKRNCVLIGIGGPSGVGKSTLAMQLTGTYNCPLMELHESSAWFSPAECLNMNRSSTTFRASGIRKASVSAMKYPRL